MGVTKAWPIVLTWDVQYGRLARVRSLEALPVPYNISDISADIINQEATDTQLLKTGSFPSCDTIHFHTCPLTGVSLEYSDELCAFRV